MSNIIRAMRHCHTMRVDDCAGKEISQVITLRYNDLKMGIFGSDCELNVRECTEMC